jgi:NAD(P)-dependent dehydrogenase (short-subunit alcohol dehydrogenase family)
MEASQRHTLFIGNCMTHRINFEGLFSLKDRIALVSGASSGLGAHFAEVLSGAGAHVVVAARRADKLTDLVKKLREQGAKADAIAMDVTSRESVQEAFQTFDSQFSRLDILVNNAGIANPPLRFVDATEDDWGPVLDVNLTGAWRVAQAAARRMKQQRNGTIVNTGSIYSHVSGSHKADYNVSKVAIDQLTKNMALELARSGVRVNSLCPGYFQTAINEKEFSTEQGKAYIQRLVPQRTGEYHELTGPLLLLVSGAGSYVNGASLVVDGGSVLSPV